MELTTAFTFLFQASYDSGILPAVWKSAWITPIFKKGDKCVASNYRPVSLTCVACKLLEHILCSEIRKFLDEHGILTPYQHGFRKFFSCESQLLVTTHDLLKRLDVREEVDIAILDFSKAFDVVPHKRLLRKLRLYGIEGRTLQWISNFLIGRTQSVMVNGVRSHSRSAPLTEIVFFQVSPKVRSWDHFCFFSTWTIYHLYLTPPQPVGFLLTTVWFIVPSNLFQTMWPCRKTLNLSTGGVKPGALNSMSQNVT